MKKKLPQDSENPQINSKDIFYVLSNSFLYTQLYFLYFLQKDFYCVHDDTDDFFFLFFRKILASVSGLFFAFFLFPYLKDFDIFLMLIFEAFVRFFDIYLPSAKHGSLRRASK